MERLTSLSEWATNPYPVFWLVVNDDCQCPNNLIDANNKANIIWLSRKFIKVFGADFTAVSWSHYSCTNITQSNISSETVAVYTVNVSARYSIFKLQNTCKRRRCIFVNNAEGCVYRVISDVSIIFVHIQVTYLICYYPC